MTKTILIVEDETDIINLIELHLSAEGYATLTAQDGHKGLELAMEQLPDLIVLDLMMPRMDGVELCKILRSSEETESIPIIMLTAKSEELDKVLGLEMGADDYITKPFSPRELIARVKAVLRRSKDLLRQLILRITWSVKVSRFAMRMKLSARRCKRG